MITVFTATYNRSNTLLRLYDSLCRQTNKKFEWLIVDDGSTDNTTELFENVFKTDEFAVRYYKKENGGKHSAINYGMPFVEGKWVFLVDSDDFLMDDAIENCLKYLETIEQYDDFCGVVFNRIYPNGNIIGTLNQYQILDTDFLSYRTKYKIRGDRAEVVRASVLLEFPFPMFVGEFFCPEGIVWNRIAQKYKVRYVNVDIYVTEYLPGGLTDLTEKLKKENPIGFSLYYLEMFRFVKSFRYKLIALGEYWNVYGKASIANVACVKPDLKLKLLSPLVVLYKFLLYLKKNS